MRVSWCTAHRGVMRISFFDPPPKHFNYPCPRCGVELNQMIKWQVKPGEQELYDKRQKQMKLIDQDLDFFDAYYSPEEILTRNNVFFEDEVVTQSPRRFCECCEYYKAGERSRHCSWCEDCPINYCDIPGKYLNRGER